MFSFGFLSVQTAVRHRGEVSAFTFKRLQLYAMQVYELQTHLTLLPEPHHPQSTILQSLNFGKQP